MINLSRISAIMLVALWSVLAVADDPFADAEIESIKVEDNIYMLSGPGGNIGVVAGDDGILLIDNKYAPLSDKIHAALAQIKDASVHYVINTHHHGDHTGGNAHLHEKGATIFAHNNVRKRLQSSQNATPAALPVVTYEQGIKVHFNDEVLDVAHLPTGHTDGDSWVKFEKANVVHTGDLFFNGRFPFIDLKAGGSVMGYKKSVQHILSKIDDNTTIIPGHGPVATKQDYQEFLSMIEQTLQTVQKMKRAGRSVEEVIAEGLDEKWQDWGWRYIDEEKWIRTLY